VITNRGKEVGFNLLFQSPLRQWNRQRYSRFVIIQFNQIVFWISLSENARNGAALSLGTLPFLANSSVVLPQMYFVVQRKTWGGHAEGAGVLGSGIVKQGALGVASFRGAETHARSVLKAISWRTMGTLDTFAISWLMTGRVEIAGSIAGFEVVTKIAWYYLHERVWAAISWGRR
jgi:uncharacterized membrane protein